MKRQYIQPNLETVLIDEQLLNTFTENQTVEEKGSDEKWGAREFIFDEEELCEE